jgi:hypothetical protein
LAVLITDLLVQATSACSVLVRDEIISQEACARM